MRPTLAFALSVGAATAALTAGTPGSASADVTRLQLAGSAAPALTADGVVYGTSGPNGGALLKFTGDGATKVLGQFAGDPQQPEVYGGSYDASPDGRVLWAPRAFSSPPRDIGTASEQVFAGSIASPLASLVSRTACPQAGTPALPAVAITDQTLAYSICQFPQQAPLTLQDSSGSRQIPREQPGDVRASGPYIAWAAAAPGQTRLSSVVVADAAGVQQTQIFAPSGQIAQFDIQADGSVAYVTDDRPNVVYLQRLGEAVPQAITTSATAIQSLSLESDVILYMARRGSTTRFTAEVTLREPDGHTTVLDTDASLVTPVDLDQTREAWVRPSCRGATMVIADLAAPKPLASTRPRCGLLLSERPSYHAGTIRLRTSCSGYAWDDVSCRQLVQARNPYTGKLLGQGRARYVAGEQSTRVRLNRAGRRYFADGAQRVRFTITGRDFNGRPERRTGVATVRRTS